MFSTIGKRVSGAHHVGQEILHDVLGEELEAARPRQLLRDAAEHDGHIAVPPGVAAPGQRGGGVQGQVLLQPLDDFLNIEGVFLKQISLRETETTVFWAADCKRLRCLH